MQEVEQIAGCRQQRADSTTAVRGCIETLSDPVQGTFPCDCLHKALVGLYQQLSGSAGQCRKVVRLSCSWWCWLPLLHKAIPDLGS